MGEPKRKSKKKRAKKKQTIDLTLTIKNVSVELEQQKKKAQPRRARVKRITSRKRMNLREMRQSLPGAGGPQAFANPAFFGNVKQLNDSALNQFQNQRYSLEQQLRDSSAEQKALLAAGKVQAAQQLADALTTQAKQLTDLQQKFGFQSQQQIAQISAAAGAEHQKAKTAEQQIEQAAIDEGDRQTRMSKVEQLTDGDERFMSGIDTRGAAAQCYFVSSQNTNAADLHSGNGNLTTTVNRTGAIVNQVVVFAECTSSLKIMANKVLEIVQ